MEMERLNSKACEELASALLQAYVDCCSLSGNIWCLSLEHTMHVIEQDLRSMCSVSLGYRKFLYDAGLSKNSYSLADGMRHLSGADYAKNPELFESVVLGALVPAIGAFQKQHSVNQKLIPNLEYCNAWIPTVCSEMLCYGITPSRYGNAMVREANAIYFERVLRSALPELSGRLGLHYIDFIEQNDMPQGFVKYQWENQIGFHEIEALFSDHWEKYLETIGQKLGVSNSNDYRNEILENWAQTCIPNHQSWKLPY